MALLSGSFLIGWVIKLGVTRFGGARTYAKGKDFMIGIIAGELLCSLAILVIASAVEALVAPMQIGAMF